MSAYSTLLGAKWTSPSGSLNNRDLSTAGNMHHLGLQRPLISCLNPHFNFDEKGM
jgi:hypothetical protein